MKYRSFILTFITYAFMHSLRNGYSFSKTYFKAEFSLSNTFLAVLDSSIYFAMGIGFFLRYFFLHRNSMILSFFITGLLFTSAFILFPLLSLANIITPSNAQVSSITLMIIYGFFQMHCWPVSLILLNDYFTNEQDGFLIAFWSSAGSIGNIIGYLFPSLLIVTLHLPWQVPQIIMGVVLLIVTLLVYLLVKRKSQIRTNQYLQLETGGQAEQIGCSQMLEGFKKFFSSFDNALLLINSCIYKTIIYTFLLWLPVYISSMGQSHDSAIIPTIFNIAGAIGTSVLGKFYQSPKEGSTSYIWLQYLWPVIGLLLIGGLVLLINMSTYSFIVFSFIIFLEGFISGGIFNILVGNEMIKISGKSETSLDIFTSVTFAVASITIGIAQLVIGVYMSKAKLEESQESKLEFEGARSDDSYDGVFKVLLALSILGFVTLLLRSCRIRKTLSDDQ